MKLSARNQLKGIITNNSAESLGLAQGKTSYAVIKASNVIVGIDE